MNTPRFPSKAATAAVASLGDTSAWFSSTTPPGSARASLEGSEATAWSMRSAVIRARTSEARPVDRASSDDDESYRAGISGSVPESSATGETSLSSGTSASRTSHSFVQVPKLAESELGGSSAGTSGSTGSRGTLQKLLSGCTFRGCPHTRHCAGARAGACRPLGAPPDGAPRVACLYASPPGPALSSLRDRALGLAAGGSGGSEKLLGGPTSPVDGRATWGSDRWPRRPPPGLACRVLTPSIISPRNVCKRASQPSNRVSARDAEPCGARPLPPGPVGLHFG